jgi:hypothetical protein
VSIRNNRAILHANRKCKNHPQTRTTIALVNMARMNFGLEALLHDLLHGGDHGLVLDETSV